jgi:hypothetical protein
MIIEFDDVGDVLYLKVQDGREFDIYYEDGKLVVDEVKKVRKEMVGLRFYPEEGVIIPDELIPCEKVRRVDIMKDIDMKKTR